jgi:small subunit ribosomal protein S11
MAEEKKAPKERRKKKIRRAVGRGMVRIVSTFNNTIITITDAVGEVICWASGGSAGFKGARKSTPFAAQVAAEQAAEKARRAGVTEIDVRISGPGPGRESAVRGLSAAGLIVVSIEDATPIPHNGCRPRKKRKV